MFRRTTLTAVAGLALLVTGCSTGSEESTKEASGEKREAATTGRVAVSTPGGIAVLDPTTLDVVDTFTTEEFTRLNAAGDGRHVFVTTSKGFQVLDTAAPELTDTTVPATTAGHVVRHADKTVLFDDGTGTTTVLETDDLTKTVGTHTAPAAHHGVSIVLEDGTLLTTKGDETARSGAVAMREEDGDWTETASSDQCPGIHGEGTAQGEAVVFGCEDGALLYSGGTFEKLDAPDEFGRMGNAYVSETSPIVVGDYKTDPDAEGYLLSSVALIDTQEKSLDVVDLPDEVQYTFRDVARGPGDRAYILSTDGNVHVLEPTTGEIVDEFPVVQPWEGPVEWQDAHPAISVDGDVAYVTEPATSSVHAVDLTTGEVTATTQLDAVPNEIAVALG
ncbi:zinc metallochaperone AztD [Aeromicrobium fastidiosum]|uniref:zinc metallochaperone AztD n=1 Tax=Aeromicrobium fastidiosum TaxID=52699 RepID=UPI00202333D9|nr:zinc metallochaperone AztD [Aeromicrobium fastidiosum]MCL8250004.1 zinc metallochaperone AztD [Aeromicrobium fastidiosum]